MTPTPTNYSTSTTVNSEEGSGVPKDTVVVGRSGQPVNAPFEAPREKVRAGRLTF
ncbi:hypothetical protein V1282_001016 [Nitrobacteraceae bacterium AZCC 2146]